MQARHNFKLKFQRYLNFRNLMTTPRFSFFHLTCLFLAIGAGRGAAIAGSRGGGVCSEPHC